MVVHWALVLGFAMSGAAITQFLVYRFLPVSEAFHWGNWEHHWIVVGATAGALLGHLGWVGAKPRLHLTRAAATCALANALVWLVFVGFTRPVDSSEFHRIDAEREQRDAEPGRMELIHDRPTIVAGRWHGTFGSVNFPDRLLTLFAAEAIGFAQVLILSSRYVGIDATRGESFAVAGVAFVLSTGFWVAFGDVVSALRRLYRRRGKSGQLRQHIP